MSTSLISCPQGHFNLLRHPHFDGKPLQAWDAADNYLLDLISEKDSTSLVGGITIVNDAFGALTVGLRELLQQSWSDSALFKIALENNLAQNNIEPDNILNRLIDLSDVPETPNSIILFKIPKSNSQLIWQLGVLAHISIPGTELWLAGMDKHITKNQFELVAQHFGPVTALKGVKKARVWQAKLITPKAKLPRMFTESYSLPDKPDFNLVQTAAVYCGEKLDQGSRFLIDQMKQMPHCEQVMDLACGNGVLALGYLDLYKPRLMAVCDESSHAVNCASENLARFKNTFPEKCADVVIQALQTDAAMNFDDNQFELILCNPPFHQGTTINTDLAQHLFKDALRVLKNEGQIWVVANRHLPYFPILKRMFGQCRQVAQNSKFVVLQATKK